VITTEVVIRLTDFGRGPASAKASAVQASEAQKSDSLAGGETEFSSNFETATQSLSSAARKSVFIRSSDDPWRREVESLQRDLKRIESNNR
jgi:hypothetical protein